MLWELVLVISDDSESALLDADTATLSLTKLRQNIDARTIRGSSAREALTLFHTRLTEPLAVLLLTALAVPLALMVERTRSLGLPALLAVAWLASFFVARNIGVTLAAEGLVPPSARPWSATLVFAAVATWRLARIPR